MSNLFLTAVHGAIQLAGTHSDKSLLDSPFLSKANSLQAIL